MHDLALATPVGQVEDVQLDIGQQLRDGVDARRARPVATTCEEGSLVEADEVAALGHGRLRHRAGDGDACRFEVLGGPARLLTPPFLSRSHEDGAALRHEPGVERVDRVRIVVQRLGEHDLRTGLLENRAEALVLPQQRGRIGLCSPAVFLPQRARSRRSGRRTSTRRSGSVIERQP